MPLLPIATWLMLAAAAPAAESSGPAATLPKPIPTRQNAFTIPFRVEQAEHPSRQPVEVQLLVSIDRGAHWQLSSRAEPARQQFLFRAPADGEYWFALRTVDRSGHVWPSGQLVPELRVIVDTAPPKLHLTATRGRDGRVTLQWRIEDANPKPESLTIQYRAAADSPWQPVIADRRGQPPGSAAATQGETTLSPPPSAQPIQIRAEAADLAGNTGIAQAQVPSAAETARNQGEQSSSRFPAEANPPSAPVLAEANPAIRNNYVPPGSGAAGPRLDGLPPGERPRMVAARSFELEYDVEPAGIVGIARVELWGTADGGRTWRHFASDEANSGRIRVKVDEEGIYGFRLTVHRAAKAESKPPQPGELPELWVGVDLTRPDARITAAEEGAAAEAGSLIIRWEASDQMLAPRPITLQFSQAQGGPWSTIAAGLENTGRYAWPLEDRLPKQVYLRVEARDEAGNVGAYEASEPVSLERARPAARIRDVRPYPAWQDPPVRGQ